MHWIPSAVLSTLGIQHLHRKRIVARTDVDEYGCLKAPFKGIALMGDGSIRAFKTEDDYKAYLRDLSIPKPEHGPQAPQGWYTTQFAPMPVAGFEIHA